MGADVIRVEKREGGEDRWVQAVTTGGEGGTFLQCNRNKRSITLDSTTPDGAAITRELVAQSDIVRSEEHTSELQSLMRISYAVFCLKKKNIKLNHRTHDDNTP